MHGGCWQTVIAIMGSKRGRRCRRADQTAPQIGSSGGDPCQIKIT